MNGVIKSVLLGAAVATIVPFVALGQQQEPLPGQPLYKAPPTAQPSQTQMGLVPGLAQPPMTYTRLRNSPEAIRQIEEIKPAVHIGPPPGKIPPGWKRMEIAARPAPTPEHLKPVVLRFEPGGSVVQHEYRFRSLASMGSPVEIRGQCISACTLVMSYVPKERLCFGEGSYLSFHAAVSSMETWAYNGPATERMYRSYPAEIKAWLDGRGGWEKLKPLEYWPLFARDLWAMGYARCQ